MVSSGMLSAPVGVVSKTPLVQTAKPSDQRLAWFPPSYPSRGAQGSTFNTHDTRATFGTQPFLPPRPLYSAAGGFLSSRVFDERGCSCLPVARWTEDASDIRTSLIQGHGDSPRIQATNPLKRTQSRQLASPVQYLLRMNSGRSRHLIFSGIKTWLCQGLSPSLQVQPCYPRSSVPAFRPAQLSTSTYLRLAKQAQKRIPQS
ncbi:hypothetical protein BKA70DRAFT_518965 [Coprinopsis sp. MPI-PUGE-AT-0042]|nr:hypothetical protein BKA70DRAFT_518965 [Coprinopsis sp. MPI-PUGE-AT-0042]